MNKEKATIWTEQIMQGDNIENISVLKIVERHYFSETKIVCHKKGYYDSKKKVLKIKIIKCDEVIRSFRSWRWGILSESKANRDQR